MNLSTNLSMSTPLDFEKHDSYYAELTRRNHHFIAPKVQARLRGFRMTVAGCGSTGGACIESLARLGVENFVLADNGTYELNNLNRQHAGIDNIGQNKAEFHASQLKRINPYSRVKVYSEGVTLDNVRLLVGEGGSKPDLIMDAVDVTSASGIAMKWALHEAAQKKGIPVFTAYDIGYCQLGIAFDYRNPKLAPLGGKLPAARAAKHPIKGLLQAMPLSYVPPHALGLIYDLLKDETTPATQLGCTSDLLSAIIVPAVVRLVETGTLIKGWNVNLETLALAPAERLKLRLQAPILRAKIRRMVAKLP